MMMHRHVDVAGRVGVRVVGQERARSLYFGESEEMMKRSNDDCVSFHVLTGYLQLSCIIAMPLAGIVSELGECRVEMSSAS